MPVKSIIPIVLLIIALIKKRLFDVTKSLLNVTKSDLVIPPNVDNHKFVDELGDFFVQK